MGPYDDAGCSALSTALLTRVHFYRHLANLEFRFIAAILANVIQNLAK